MNSRFRMILCHKIKLTIMIFGLALAMNIPVVTAKEKAHFSGPNGGSYHFVGKWGSGKNKTLLYCEWFVHQSGEVKLCMRQSRGGRLVNEPLKIKSTVSSWVSLLGNEGLSAKKFSLKSQKNNSEPSTFTVFSGQLPKKFHGKKLFVVIPEVVIDGNKFRSSGPVFPVTTPSKKEIKNNIK